MKSITIQKRFKRMQNVYENIKRRKIELKLYSIINHVEMSKDETTNEIINKIYNIVFFVIETQTLRSNNATRSNKSIN